MRASGGERSARRGPCPSSRQGPPPLEQLWLGQAFYDRSVVAVIVVTGPNSLPPPRCRLPTPARAAIETNASDERHGREGEAAGGETLAPGQRKTTGPWSQS